MRPNINPFLIVDLLVVNTRLLVLTHGTCSVISLQRKLLPSQVKVLKVIREIENLAQVPVILLSVISSVTGDDYDPEKIHTRYGVLPDAFVSKPIKPDSVREQLAKFATS